MCSYSSVAKDCIQGPVTAENLVLSIKKYPVHAKEILLFGMEEISLSNMPHQTIQNEISHMVKGVASVFDMAA